MTSPELHQFLATCERLIDQADGEANFVTDLLYTKDEPKEWAFTVQLNGHEIVGKRGFASREEADETSEAFLGALVLLLNLDPQVVH